MIAYCKKCGKPVNQPRKIRTGLCKNCWLASIRSPDTTHAKIKLCPSCKEVMISGCARTCVKCMGNAMKGKNKGNSNGSWKGGQKHSPKGYVRILQPEHPRADKTGYVSEHIVNWEKAHNKPLPKEYVIHHLNGIPSDNRPCNLIALPDRKHKHILAAKAKRIQQLEALLSSQQQLI